MPRQLPMKMLRHKFLCATVLSGAVLCVLYGLRPLSDPDFWWQLKTGEEMVRSGGLLGDNPFNFHSDGVLTALERRVLHGYWVWQLAYYAVYAVTGLAGILMLNVLLALAIFGLLAWLLGRNSPDASLGALLLFLSMAAFLPYYQLERPQVLSFLCGLGLIVLFDRFRDQRVLSPWLFPLMLLWGNVHGGVVVGFGLLACFMVGVSLQLGYERRLVVRCALWVSGGVLCGLLNPTAIYAAVETARGLLAGPRSYGEGVQEFNSTFRFFSDSYYWVVCAWALMILHAAGLCLARRRWLADYLLFVVVLLASVFYMRNIGFFVVSLLPQTMHYLGQAGFAGKRVARRVAVTGALTLLLLLTVNWQMDQSSLSEGLVKRTYPQRLATFIRETGIAGRAFNDYDWGGYLVWSLYPESRLFIDSRNLDPTTYDHWLKIRWISPRPLDGRYEYESLLDRYGVEYVVQKNFSRSGLTEPLARSLLRRGDWIPVYQDDLGYVLVRDLPKYRAIIDQHRIGPRAFWENILQWYQRRIASSNDPRMYLGRGELYLYLGDAEAARRDLLMAKQSLGEDAYLDQLLKRTSP